MFANFFSSAAAEPGKAEASESSGKPLIVITGITGFIGSHLLAHCIDSLAGEYRIRGTARNPSDYDKMEPLYNYFGGEEALKARVEIVHADLQDADSIDQAVQGASYVIHTANPVGLSEPTDPNEMVLPSLQGALSIMRAASKHSVKRVVITSSAAAIESQTPETMLCHPVLDESHWSQLNAEGVRVSAYGKSKTIAEKAAWNFLKEIPDDAQKPELVTILPGLVLG